MTSDRPAVSIREIVPGEPMTYAQAVRIALDERAADLSAGAGG